ncbi:hypothetical protein CH253_08195 [Rhodococcus sp. 06-156-3C]|nr:hypothetical protein CH253_08195 [Rhodococcus sp. 06-156-3C]
MNHAHKLATLYGLRVRVEQQRFGIVRFGGDKVAEHVDYRLSMTSEKVKPQVRSRPAKAIA